MNTSQTSSFDAQRGMNKSARNICPTPVRRDESFYASAFLADRGVKLPPMAVKFERSRKSA
jgi:hypothetical protein